MLACDHAAIDCHHDLGEPEAPGELADLEGQAPCCASNRRHRDRHGAAVAVAQQPGR